MRSNWWWVKSTPPARLSSHTFPHSCLLFSPPQPLLQHTRTPHPYTTQPHQQEVLSAFGFSEYEINLSTRPDKYVGDDDIWHTAEAALKEALAAKGWAYGVDEGGELGAQLAT